MARNRRKRIAYVVLAGKDERTKTLARPRSRSDVSIEIIFKKMECKNMGLIYMPLVGWLFVCFVGWLLGWLVIQSDIQPVI